MPAVPGILGTSPIAIAGVPARCCTAFPLSPSRCSPGWTRREVLPPRRHLIEDRTTRDRDAHDNVPEKVMLANATPEGI